MKAKGVPTSFYSLQAQRNTDLLLVFRGKLQALLLKTIYRLFNSHALPPKKMEMQEHLFKSPVNFNMAASEY